MHLGTMAKKQPKSVLNTDLLSPESLPVIEAVLDEMSWDLDIVFVSLKSANMELFFNTVKNLLVLSQRHGFEVLEDLCFMTLESRESSSPNLKIFMNTIYEHYFSIRREFRTVSLSFNTDAKQKTAA